jgi:UDP-N-acetylglucosamine 1-carboxyvinyltransferase
MRKGTTHLFHAAREPEIVELCDCLRKMGAKISGDGTSRITIHGGKKLHGVHHCLSADRIAFLTYGVMAAATRGRAVLHTGGNPCRMEGRYLSAAGCEVREENGYTEISARRGIRPIPFLKTEPYPGFPTDAQSLFLTLFTKGSGECILEEGVFENRFLLSGQLRKMGADIEVAGQRACVRSVTRLHGERVTATDLRSGAALLAAGTMADGKTLIEQCELILRGYEEPVENMRKLGLWARYICE